MERERDVSAFDFEDCTRLTPPEQSRAERLTSESYTCAAGEGEFIAHKKSPTAGVGTRPQGRCALGLGGKTEHARDT
jgi:hypothetical protein